VSLTWLGWLGGGEHLNQLAQHRNKLISIFRRDEAQSEDGLEEEEGSQQDKRERKGEQASKEERGVEHAMLRSIQEDGKEGPTNLTEAPLHKVVPQFLVHQISLDRGIDVVLSMGKGQTRQRSRIRMEQAREGQGRGPREEEGMRTCLSAIDCPITR
jgi:hypothetical protein